MSDKVFRDYYGLCDFNVGMLFSHDGYAFLLHDACQQVGIDYPIDYVFGSAPCLFQGGRAAPTLFSDDQVEDLIGRYASIGVGCRLTFSNYELEEADLEDPQSNRMLELISKSEGNGVIVSSDLLARHIRRNYPNLQLISSLVKPTVENTLGTETAEYYNSLFELYDIVVVNSAFAYDDDYLSRIEHPGRVEFIANHRCRRNCPLSATHYTTQTRSARAASTGNRIAQRRLEASLVKINEGCLARRKANPLDNSLISTERIGQLVGKGFRHFKLEGRDYPMPVLVRDIGNWIFEAEGVYTALAHSILGQPL